MTCVTGSAVRGGDGSTVRSSRDPASCSSHKDQAAGDRIRASKGGRRKETTTRKRLVTTGAVATLGLSAPLRLGSLGRLGGNALVIVLKGGKGLLGRTKLAGQRLQKCPRDPSIFLD